MMKKVSFSEIFTDTSRLGISVNISDLSVFGDIPVIDQSKHTISGYINDSYFLYKGRLPCIIFGDHSKVVKYIDYKFAIGGQGVKVLTVKDGINVKFAYYSLKNLKLPETGYDRTYKFLKHSKFILPPLLEQNKIVAILDKISSLIEKRNNSVGLLNDIIKSAFLDTFGDPVSNPKNWKLSKIEPLILSIKAGKSITGINRPKQNGEIGVLKVSAVTYGNFQSEQNKYVEKELLNLNELIFPKNGDLLMTRANTKELVGATSIVDKDYNDIFLPDKIWKLNLNSELIQKSYLHMIFSNKSWRNFYTKDANGSGGSMFNISQENFKNITIPLPEKYVQDKFDKIYNLYLRNNINLNRYLLINQSLFQVIQKRIFEGEESLKEDKIFDELINNFELKDFFDDKQRINYLIDFLSNNKFKTLIAYEKAEKIAFQLLRMGEITQLYNSGYEKITLTRKNETY